MRFLLDTHVFIWWIEGNEELPARVRSLLDDPANTLFLSSAVTWEISMKCAAGKLEMSEESGLFLADLIQRLGLSLLSITVEHTLRVGSLPFIHKDPFDRILISQAICENLTILTADALVKKYDVETLW